MFGIDVLDECGQKMILDYRNGTITATHYFYEGDKRTLVIDRNGDGFPDYEVIERSGRVAEKHTIGSYQKESVK